MQSWREIFKPHCKNPRECNSLPLSANLPTFPLLQLLTYLRTQICRSYSSYRSAASWADNLLQQIINNSLHYASMFCWMGGGDIDVVLEKMKASMAGRRNCV
ncbi:hypothetical protein QN277_025178 [Acacia crassicarpa]|uniref:Uncharacterized protein n=1 Tax=Acacia crassicarpa TaxID=499986 RepID=A0AAE1JGF5_9FABA|nr:hypothetical protein QN277_025178 [Acacia crassicarpa]